MTVTKLCLVCFRLICLVAKGACLLCHVRPVRSSFCLAVRLLTCISAFPTGQIAVEFCIGDFFETLLRKSKFG